MVVLPGWWKLFGVSVLSVGLVSYVHHTNEKFELSIGTWGKLDVLLANMVLVTGIIVLIVTMTRPDTRKAVGVDFALAIGLLGLYSIFIFFLSQVAEKKAGAQTYPAGWGTGPLLSQTSLQPESPPDCSSQRYQADYLSIHSTWHSLSAATCILFVVAIKRAFSPNLAVDPPVGTV